VGIAGGKSVLEQIIHCKNYQQMTQKAHHSEHPLFMNSPARLQCINKELSQNKVTNTHENVIVALIAHAQQMVHIRHQSSHHYHLGICPTMVPRLIFQGKALLSSVCSQEVVPCFPISIYCNHLPAKCFSWIQ